MSLIKIPPIPAKKIGRRRFEEDYVIKRMLFLENFLQNIANVEDFKATTLLLCFLTEKERNKFDAKMNVK